MMGTVSVAPSTGEMKSVLRAGTEGGTCNWQAGF